MNAIIENLLTRRSTRAFLQREIPDNELNEILQAAIYAPSGMGKQTWKFTVLCNQEKIQQLAELIGRKLGRKGYDMYRPQVLIIALLSTSISSPDTSFLCAYTIFPFFSILVILVCSCSMMTVASFSPFTT